MVTVTVMHGFSVECPQDSPWTVRRIIEKPGNIPKTHTAADENLHTACVRVQLRSPLGNRAEDELCLPVFEVVSTNMIELRSNRKQPWRKLCQLTEYVQRKTGDNLNAKDDGVILRIIQTELPVVLGVVIGEPDLVCHTVQHDAGYTVIQVGDFDNDVLHTYPPLLDDANRRRNIIENAGLIGIIVFS